MSNLANEPKPPDCCVFCKNTEDYHLYFVGIVVIGLCQACIVRLAYDELKRLDFYPTIHTGGLDI